MTNYYYTVTYTTPELDYLREVTANFNRPTYKITYRGAARILGLSKDETVQRVEIMVDER